MLSNQITATTNWLFLLDQCEWLQRLCAMHAKPQRLVLRSTLNCANSSAVASWRIFWDKTFFTECRIFISRAFEPFCVWRSGDTSETQPSASKFIFIFFNILEIFPVKMENPFWKKFFDTKAADSKDKKGWARLRTARIGRLVWNQIDSIIFQRAGKQI